MSSEHWDKTTRNYTLEAPAHAVPQILYALQYSQGLKFTVFDTAKSYAFNVVFTEVMYQLSCDNHMTIT